jgi:hypothetical protein
MIFQRFNFLSFQSSDYPMKAVRRAHYIRYLLKYFPVSIIRLMLLKSLRMRKTAYIVNKECNKSLKIPKGKSESVNRWRTEKNGQKKKEKRTNNIYKHTYKTKDRVTQTPLKTGDELMCSRRVSSFCSTSGTRRVNLVTNPVISHDLTRTWMRMKITVLYNHERCHINNCFRMLWINRLYENTDTQIHLENKLRPCWN